MRTWRKKSAPSPGTLPGRYQPEDQLLAFLRSL
jgi:hypothetical protein